MEELLAKGEKVNSPTRALRAFCDGVRVRTTPASSPATMSLGHDTERVLTMAREGATFEEITDATGFQPEAIEKFLQRGN